MKLESIGAEVKEKERLHENFRKDCKNKSMNQK